MSHPPPATSCKRAADRDRSTIRGAGRAICRCCAAVAQDRYVEAAQSRCAYWMIPMQHRLLMSQYVDGGHGMLFAQLVVPIGHSVMPPHSGGRSLGSWPGHRMQPPQVLPHVAVGVQRRHFVGSEITSIVQFGDVDGLVATS